MVCLNGKSISKCHLLQLALVIILLISQYSSAKKDDGTLYCYYCKPSKYEENYCKLIAPYGLLTTCNGDFCYVLTHNGKVYRNCESELQKEDAEMTQHGKLCKCYSNYCNRFNVTEKLDKCFKDLSTSSVGQLQYLNAIGLLISLCGITLWFVITTNISSNSIGGGGGGFDGGSGPL